MNETEVGTDDKNEMIGYFLEQIRLRTVTNKALIDKIMRQREQLRALNNVAARRKWALRKHREYTDAVKELHRPIDGTDLSNTKCRECAQAWPCRTNEAVTAVVMDKLPEHMRRVLTGDKSNHE